MVNKGTGINHVGWTSSQDRISLQKGLTFPLHYTHINLILMTFFSKIANSVGQVVMLSDIIP